jgi:hypothetical protein
LEWAFAYAEEASDTFVPIIRYRAIVKLSYGMSNASLGTGSINTVQTELRDRD